ncbi:hypothetical protein QWM81_26180 [Streptomyces ficellus]|uniref:Uncharacterized protein n=1 Tax=Streptomyces ficellus TaxID=1977088 RepID=A0ABT7ZD69_9ACTN|nr:hypothetical protein [Streptomyces ficellus]MDN3297463.1 hypothetical protein [Streptomyces ficellus]
MARVRDVVHAVVAEQAAHELPLVEGLLHFDDARAVRILSGQGRRKEPLGFGFAEAAALVTPVVWLVLDQVARHGVEVVTDSVMERLRGRLRGVLRRGAGASPVELVELDSAQLARVRERVLERAVERGMSRREAEALADGVVARLATEQAERAQEPEQTEQAERAEQARAEQVERAEQARAERAERGEGAERAGTEGAPVPPNTPPSPTAS